MSDARKDLFRTAAADFDHPLEMLAACHDRIQERCDLLHRLGRHVTEVGADEQARQAAANIMRYFDTAAENHHRDEEEDVFPRLLSVDAAACERLVVQLRDEHARMRDAWAALRPMLARIAAGEATALDAGQLERFTVLHRNHIALEERELFPLAQRLFDDGALTATGDAMAERRGVKR
jgi:hemerythrin-like domain-containing protein